MIKTANRYQIVFVTCASRTQARKIARAIVSKQLAACANILPSVESIYRWKGKVETAREVMLLIKTTAGRLAELEREVQRLHTYEVPEFVAIPIAAGSHAYLKWIEENTAQ